MRLAILLAVSLGVSGCAGMPQSRPEKFERTTRAYESAIRWGEFQNAFVLAAPVDGITPDFRRLQDVRVTSYGLVTPPKANENGSKIVQTVEIRYLYIQRMAERSLIDQQIWIFSPTDSRWRLASPFPVFPP